MHGRSQPRQPLAAMREGRATMNRSLQILGVLASTMIVAGCSSIPDRNWPIAESEQPSNTPLNGAIRIIQIDEGASAGVSTAQVDGEFFNEKDFSDIKDWLDAGAPRSPIVVFVHGWHHNASGKKKNLEQFRKFISTLQRDLCSLARTRDQVEQCAPVQGLFVGWRGDSLDPFLLPDILDFPTFGDRKDASARVGAGGLRDLVLEMESRYRDRHVVFAGHSLGANALYHAIGNQAKFEVEDLHEYFFLNPATTSEEFKPLFDQLARQVGFNASQLGMENMMSSRAVALRIERRENRKVMVIQAEGDWVVGKLFRSQHGLPIGFDEKRRTHQAEATDLQACPRLVGKELESYCSIELESGLSLAPSNGSTEEQECKAIFSEPVWVVAADRSFSKSHGDVWNAAQRCALAELIAKRIVRVPGY